MQSEALTQHRNVENAKANLLPFCPDFSENMLSPSEWADFDKMLHLGINSFINSKTCEPTLAAVDPVVKAEGSLQALACVLGDCKPEKEFRKINSIFSGMNVSAQKEFWTEVLAGLHSTEIEVVASSLRILGHWTSSCEGTLKYSLN